MVDVVMMDHLFQAVDPVRTKVILMGDKDQLPSVEAGSVLADISNAARSSRTEHVIELHTVYRSTGELLELARLINAGKAVELQPVAFDEALAQSEGKWAFVTEAGPDRLHRHLYRWVRHHFNEPTGDQSHSYVTLAGQAAAMPAENEAREPVIERLFAFAFQCRILTVLRHGATGMRSINNTIASALAQQLDPSSSLPGGLFNGAMIMVTRNDYERQLFNGDAGVVLGEPDGGYKVWFRRSDRLVSFPVSGLPDWELAFAMTVHKSQGSEFDDTLLVLPDDAGHRLLTREIIYTAATRAARRLIVYGSVKAFQTALKRKIQRQSGL